MYCRAEEIYKGITIFTLQSCPNLLTLAIENCNNKSNENLIRLGTNQQIYNIAVLQQILVKVSSFKDYDGLKFGPNLQPRQSSGQT